MDRVLTLRENDGALVAKEEEAFLDQYIKFPFELLVDKPKDQSIIKAFRFFVDAINGSDENDGQSWQNPLKSFEKILDIIPDEGFNYDVDIFHTGGNYNIELQWGKKNYTFIFFWVGPGLKDSNDNYINFGLTQDYPMPDEPAYFTFVNVISFRYSKFVFISRDDHDMSKVAWGRYIWKLPEGVSREPITMFQDKSDFYFDNIVIDMTNVLNVGIMCGAHLKIASVGVIGNPSIGNDMWRGAFVIPDWGTARDRLIIGQGFLPSWSINYPRPHGKLVDIVNQKSFISTQLGNPSDVIIDTSSIYFDPGSTGVSKVRVYLASNLTGGKVFYDGNSVEVINLAKKSILIDTSTNTIIDNISDKIKQNGNDITINVDTDIPSDTILQNKDISFYLDQANNKLKVKVKFSNGTIKNGEISLI